MLLGETVLHEDEDVAVKLGRELREGESLDVDRADREPGALEINGHEFRWQQMQDVRLALGVWRESGGWDPVDDPTSERVPLSVAAARTAVLASYLMLGMDRRSSTPTDRKRARQTVADLLDVKDPRTISNYASEVRVDWTEI